MLGLKNKLIAFGGLVLAGLVAALKYAWSAKEEAEEERDYAQADTKRVVRTQKRELEIDQEYSHRAEVANEEIQAGEIPSHLAKRRVR